MNTFSKLQLAFVIIILLFASYGGYSIHKMDSIGNSTVNIFNHPLTVSKATLELNANILEASNNYLQLINAKEPNQTLQKIQTITKSKLATEKDFEIITNRYLGPKEDIDQIEKLYTQYFLAIEQHIAKPAGHTSSANLAKTMIEHEAIRDKLLTATQVVLDFASNKANQFLEASSKESFKGQMFSLVGLLIFSLIMSFYIVRMLREANKATSQQLHLIDQNILSCELDPSGKVITMSNALARAFNVKDSELIGEDSNFFVDSEEERRNLVNHISTGETYSLNIERIVNEEHIWFEMKMSPQFDDEFKIQSFQAFFNDITSEKRIEEVSIKDALTGLYNRNYFELVFAKELRKAKRDKKPFAVLLLDVDFFKQYNDNYGHLQGDYALKSVSSIISKCTQRSYDTAFRVGGEEFLIIFDVESEKQTEAFCEKLRKGVESLAISHEGSSISPYLTISIGACTCLPNHILDENQVYNTVDQQLYLAKNQGRNRIQSQIVQ
ncbi:MAG: diguanylate cyclase [Pseudomonadota bacterium]|nr:diguanylate cyclase [Pseudomonadota bacterium]